MIFPKAIGNSGLVAVAAPELPPDRLAWGEYLLTVEASRGKELVRRDVRFTLE